MALVIRLPNALCVFYSCLGIWRFHHIDVSSCPQLPDRLVDEAKAEGESPDVLRASRALGLSKEQLHELVAEVQ